MSATTRVDPNSFLQTQERVTAPRSPAPTRDPTRVTTAGPAPTTPVAQSAARPAANPAAQPAGSLVTGWGEISRLLGARTLVLPAGKAERRLRGQRQAATIPGSSARVVTVASGTTSHAGAWSLATQTVPRPACWAPQMSS
jgi:hypothetical protein